MEKIILDLIERLDQSNKEIIQNISLNKDLTSVNLNNEIDYLRRDLNSKNELIKLKDEKIKELEKEIESNNNTFTRVEINNVAAQKPIIRTCALKAERYEEKL